MYTPTSISPLTTKKVAGGRSVGRSSIDGATATAITAMPKFGNPNHTVIDSTPTANSWATTLIETSAANA